MHIGKKKECGRNCALAGNFYKIFLIIIFIIIILLNLKMKAYKALWNKKYVAHKDNKQSLWVIHAVKNFFSVRIYS